MTASVLTVAVGRPRRVERNGGRTASTAIWKDPVAGPVRVLDENLEGDEQADLRNHGGPDKAVYAYATEDAAWWRAELGRDLETAAFGQNLTTAGYDLRAAVVGERWEIGDAVLQVAQPRTPCFKLGLRTGDGDMPRRFLAAVRPGVYLRVLRRGVLHAGDAVRVVDRPAHGITVAEVFTIFHHERERAARLLEVDALPAAYHAWARERGGAAAP